ncbi:helix-turn-helix transcriptional regulator [Streptomyces sp. NPDC049906]|uniref:helix-turn-helix domain-containing protein n=1 Tax=Streptomyces sp. NPDC049906 TaxID=3155656 RepID=UPI00343AAF65
MSSDEEQDHPRRRFAEELRSARELHEDGPLTQTELAKRTRTSKSTISRLETTDCPIPPELPELFDQVFATNGKFKALYEACIAADFPAVYRRRMELELQADSIWEWSSSVVPGLLQTAPYAGVLLGKGSPRATKEEIAASVRKRLARQKILRSSAPPDLRVILCESVLMRLIGGREVMREQLGTLLDQHNTPTTHVRILPIGAEAHLLLDSSASFITLPNRRTPVICVEAYYTAGIIEDPERVKAAVRAYTDLMGEALSAKQSADLIVKYMEKL